MQYYKYEGEDIHLQNANKTTVIFTNSIYTIIPTNKYFLFMLQDENNTTIKVDQKVVSNLMQDSQELYIEEAVLSDVYGMNVQKLKEKELKKLVSEYVTKVVDFHSPHLKTFSLTKNYEQISETLNNVINELETLKDLSNIDELIVKFKKNPVENVSYDKDELVVKEGEPYKYIKELEENAYVWLLYASGWTKNDQYSETMVIPSLKDALSLLKVAHNISTDSLDEAAENANLDTLIRDSYSKEFYNWFANHKPATKISKKMK